MASADQAGFEILYRENVRSVMAYVLTRTTKDNAPDAVSSTFLVAWRRFADVPDDALPWLLGVARRVLADQFRSEARRNALTRRLIGDVVTDSESSADTADRLLLRGSIRAAVLRLRPAEREVLMLVAWQGFTTEQLAVSLGCSKALATLRLHRARKRFGELFEDEQRAPAPLTAFRSGKQGRSCEAIRN